MIPHPLRFDLLKRQVSVMQVLVYYGLAHRLRARGLHWLGPCPLHGGDNPSAFVVTPHKNLWRCFTACQQGGDVISLVQKLELCSYLQAAQRLASLCGARPREPKLPPLSPRSFSPFRQSLALDPHCSFLKSKGIRPETARTFEVGLYHGSGFLDGCIGLRLHDANGQPLGYLGRRLQTQSLLAPRESYSDPPCPDPATEPKWKCPSGLPKRTLLYNYHRARFHFRRTLVITECPWGVLRMAQLHLPAVALLGVHISNEQLTLLTKASSLLLLLDGDRAGRLASVQLKEILSKHVPTSIASLPDGADPDDLTDEALRELLPTTGY